MYVQPLKKKLGTVFTQQDDLRQFERFFFAFLASTELLSEVVAFVVILLGAYYDIRIESGSKGWMQVARIGQAMVRDPIHNLADLSTSTFPDSKIVRGGLMLSLFFAVIPVSAWTLFVPLWPFFDEDDDRSLKLWICCSMWAMSVLVVPITTLYLGSGSDGALQRWRGNPGAVVGVYVVYYSFNKVVALSLLFSRGDRLASGRIGETLRALQVAELSSAVRILWQLVTDDDYAAKFSNVV